MRKLGALTDGEWKVKSVWGMSVKDLDETMERLKLFLDDKPYINQMQKAGV